MRKLILTTATALSAATAICSSDYVPMIREDRVWEYQGSYFLPDEYGVIFHRMKFDGSVVFNEKEYHCFRLYESTLVNSKTGESRTEKREGPVFLLREEPGKVYALSYDEYMVMSYCGNDNVPALDGDRSLYEDFLIYDFTVEEDQTVSVPFGRYVRGTVPMQAQWDEPLIIGGEKCGVLRYSFSGMPEKIKYIEGIGITANGSLPLFEPMYTSSIFDDSYDYPWRHSILNAVYNTSGETIYDYVGYGSIPLLKEGKVWVWNGVNLIEDKESPVYFTVAGTEDIDGKRCFRVEQTSDIPELSGGSWLLYEEGGKVSIRYTASGDYMEWLPLFDFSMRKGDESQIWEVHENHVCELDPGNRWKVAEESQIHVSGVTRRKLNLVNDVYNRNTVWIEGIGAPYLEGQLTWFCFPEPDNGIFLGGFRECIEDGEVIFTFADFGDPGSVDGIADDSASAIADDATYDVMGRRVSSTVPGSVYIRGGRKFVAK